MSRQLVIATVFSILAMAVLVLRSPMCDGAAAHQGRGLMAMRAHASWFGPLPSFEDLWGE